MSTTKMPTTIPVLSELLAKQRSLRQRRTTPSAAASVLKVRLPALGETVIVGEAKVTVIEVSARGCEPSSVFYEIRPVS